MNTSFPRIASRPLLVICLFLTALVPVRAENWQQFELRLNPGRVGHIFSMLGPGDATATVLSQSLNPNSAIPVTISSDVDQPLTIFDETAGDHLDWSAASGNDLRLAVWYLLRMRRGRPMPQLNSIS